MTSFFICRRQDMDAESIIREASVAVGAFGWVFSPFVSIFSILSIFTFCAMMMILCFLGHFNNLWAFSPFVRKFWAFEMDFDLCIISLIFGAYFELGEAFKLLDETLSRPPPTPWDLLAAFSQDGWLKFARLPVRGSHSPLRKWNLNPTSLETRQPGFS